MNSFKEDVLKAFKIELSDYQLEQFETYFQFLIEYNENVNLTRIVERDDVYYKHFFDSLTILKDADMKKIKNICDIGSGAGFPSIPIKIVFPELKVYIVDSLGKRITFLEELTKKLNLENVFLTHERAEDYALKNQTQFDLVTARAFGKLPLIVEIGLPMLKMGKTLIALKTSNFADELKDSFHGIKILGSQLKKVNEFELPHDYGKRANIIIKKIVHVRGYPRPYQQMLKKVL